MRLRVGGLFHTISVMEQDFVPYGLASVQKAEEYGIALMPRPVIPED